MERGLLEQNAVGPTLEQARGGKELPVFGPERRQRTRVLSQLPLTVKFGGIYEIGAEAVNISARGMLFVLPQRLATGESIELVFRLPRRVIGVDGIWLRCPAEVMRVEEGPPEGKFRIGAKIKDYEVFLG